MGRFDLQFFFFCSINHAQKTTSAQDFDSLITAITKEFSLDKKTTVFAEQA